MDRSSMKAEAEYGAGSSVVRVQVFSRWFEVVYNGPDHETEAARCANDWNTMFEEELDTFRGAAGAVMERFIELLLADDVPEDVVKGALDRMLEDVRE